MSLKRYTATVAGALTVAGLAATPATLAQQQAGPTAHAPTEVLELANSTFICVFDRANPPANVSARADVLAARYNGILRHKYTAAIRGFAVGLSPRAAARLVAQNPDVQYCERDGVVQAFPKPPRPGDDSGGGGGGQETPWGITRVGGPALTPGPEQYAWVIDTGIDLDHSDLNVDQGCSANFVPWGRKSPDDGHGHGTHVAGTIAAINNGIDVVGVAPGATLCAVRVLDNSGSGTISAVVAGVDYVAENGRDGDVANMSLGASGHWDSLHSAIVTAANKGVLFAIAAGNNGADAENYEPAHIVESNNVFTVTAIDSSDELASWSNWGNPPVDFAAPGVNVLSTKKGGGTTTMSGTSMATPHVAGLLFYGPPNSDGNAKNDPDGIADPIASD